MALFKFLQILFNIWFSRRQLDSDVYCIQSVARGLGWSMWRTVASEGFLWEREEPLQLITDILLWYHPKTWQVAIS